MPELKDPAAPPKRVPAREAIGKYIRCVDTRGYPCTCRGTSLVARARGSQGENYVTVMCRKHPTLLLDHVPVELVET